MKLLQTLLCLSNYVSILRNLNHATKNLDNISELKELVELPSFVVLEDILGGNVGGGGKQYNRTNED